jgi:transcription elongation GreA/GreB family factor
MRVDKVALRAELLALLTAALETARVAHAAAVEGATHTEARAENDKDTRGLEQSYLARGQALRVAELESGVGDVAAMTVRPFEDTDPIAIGAVVTIADGQRYLIAPAGGGSTIAGDIQVITPASPIGRALAGKRVDDEVEVRIGGKTRELEIVAIE